MTGRAGADLDIAVRLDPTNPTAWAERSRVWLSSRNPARAAALMSKKTIASLPTTRVSVTGEAGAGRKKGTKAKRSPTTLMRSGSILDPWRVSRVCFGLIWNKAPSIGSSPTRPRRSSSTRNVPVFICFAAMRGTRNKNMKRQSMTMPGPWHRSGIRLCVCLRTPRPGGKPRLGQADRRLCDGDPEAHPHNAAHRLFRQYVGDAWKACGRLEDYDESVRLEP